MAHPRTPARRPPAPVLLSLLERLGADQATVVDRAAKVVRNVKVCGLVSDNGREYPAGTLTRSLALYENTTVYTDHPPRPGQARGTREAFGVLRNFRFVAADGTRADLHYLPKHALTEDVLDDVERRLGIFGLSHNVDARVERRNGVDVVTEIVKVRSVDLVTDPATNKNLWESRRMATTLKQIIESSTLAKRAKRALLEMEGMGDTLAEPMEAPEPESDGRKLLAQAVAALVGGDDDADHELAAKVMKLLKPESADGLEEGDDEDLEEGDEGYCPPAKKTEGKKARKPAPGTATLTEDRAKRLLKGAGRAETRELVEALTGLDLDRALAVLALAPGAPARRGPTSSAPGAVQPVTEGKAEQVPEDPEALKRWVNGR
jgi:hypothetical protein